MPKKKTARRKTTRSAPRNNFQIEYNSFAFFLFVVFVLLATLYVFYR